METPAIFLTIAGIAIAWGVWLMLRLIRRRRAFANIQGPPCKSWLRGNLSELMNTQGWNYHKEISERYGGAFKVKAHLGEDALYVHDPKALQHIIIKEQHIYQETDLFIRGNEVVLGEGLLATLGEQHRKQRKMLNPVFSIAHMREMTPTFYKVVHKLGDAFQAKVKNGPATIEVLSWMTRTALELIGQSGLGCSFDTLTENGKQHKFSVSAKLLAPVGVNLLFWRTMVLPYVCRLGPARFRRAVVDVLSTFWTELRRYRDIVDVIAETSVEILEEKKEALRQGDEDLKARVGRGQDIMSVLLKSNMSVSDADKLTEKEMVGQVASLTFAAMDTTSNALSRTLHLMCLHQDAQDKLRQEIVTALEEHGELGHDELVNLPYLDAICRETMRLYPPVPTVMRQCTQDSMLPVSKPIFGVDGTPINEIFVPKGTRLFVSIISSNRNPELWGPDSYEWKPERWLSPTPDALVNAKIPGVYSNLMTFIGGSRACIGFKFSQLEMKVVLVELISRFKFELGEHRNIYWQMGGIVTPILDETSILEPQLPLKVSAVKSS